MFRSLLFSRIVPCVKDIGLWGEKVQKCYADMGVLDMAGVNLDELMKADEDQAELIDREKAEMARAGRRGRRDRSRSAPACRSPPLPPRSAHRLLCMIAKQRAFWRAAGVRWRRG